MILSIIGRKAAGYFKGNERNGGKVGGHVNIFMLLCYIFFANFLNNINGEIINQK